jgi:hypothetical protein
MDSSLVELAWNLLVSEKRSSVDVKALARVRLGPPSALGDGV